VSIRRRTFSAVVRAVELANPPFETFSALSRIAEDATLGALALAASACGIAPASLKDSPFVVLALGRLGTQEMDIASDADLVFIADESLTADSREPWRRAAEQFVHIAGSHTREGLLLPVDTRLRPRGAESDLVQSGAYLRDYCNSEAQAWEALAWLKARPIAGNSVLGARAIRAAQEILISRFSGGTGLVAELRAMRGKIEKDAEGIRAKGEFKKITGGYYDVEYILGYLFISRTVPPLPAHVLRQIAALENAGALDTASAITLRAGAFLYRALDHAVRLVTGRAANRLPEPALAERVVSFLEDWRVPLAADSSKDAATRLAATVSATRAQLRALFERFLSK
jgi:glutamate-ammonia-ligase adenylyltransferase